MTNNRIVLEEKSVKMGDYKKNLKGATLFVDYYHFLGTSANSVAIHVNPKYSIKDSSKPVTQFQVGLLFPFKKKDDEKSSVNIEIFYQLKDVFDHFNTAFPLLMPRSFAGVLKPSNVQKLKKAGLSFEDIFKEENELVKEKVIENTTFKLDLDEQREKLKSIFLQAQEQAIQIDTTLEKLVLAEHKKSINSIEKIEQKILKAERKNQEVLVNRIYTLKEILFPGGSPQERKDNFLNFYLSNNKFINSCMETFDPFDYRFHLIEVNE